MHQLANQRNMLFLFMGSGKTAITLTTINHLQQHGVISGALICGPLRVVQSVWEKEARKWQHLEHLTFSLIHGTPAERIHAVFKKANIHLINYEGLSWLRVQLEHYLLSRGLPLPWQFLVLDESSKVKNTMSQRVGALVNNVNGWPSIVSNFPWRTGLTGTPAPNGLIDLHGQYRCIDDGQRLGRNISDYRGNYFKSSGFGGYSYTCESPDTIHQAIADITLEMSQEDYLTLPDFIVQDVSLDLPEKARVQYDQLEKEFFIEFDDGGELEVDNAAARINKLIQFSNGHLYVDPVTREWKRVHDLKLDALEDIIEEAAGSPILLGYIFRTDAMRIQQRFKYAVNLTGMNGDEFNQAISDFAAGKIKLLMGHPASMGHGTDGLQFGSSILVWFGIPWGLELYQQLNKRLHRQGQGEPVRAYRILCNQTMDQAVSMALEVKDATQSGLREAVKQYREVRGL